MPKEILALFRKLLALDEKSLPDSITSEEFKKVVEESDLGSFIKPEDFKNLQKTLSSKDIELKKALDEVAKFTKKVDAKKTESEKKLEEMGGTISELQKTIATLNTNHETERLTKEFPDILSEFLVGKTPEEITSVVDRQREVNKKIYGDSQHFSPAGYSSEEDLDKAIEDVKEDVSKNGENSAVSILQLNREKESFSKKE